MVRNLQEICKIPLTKLNTQIPKILIPISKPKLYNKETACSRIRRLKEAQPYLPRSLCAFSIP